MDMDDPSKSSQVSIEFPSPSVQIGSNTTTHCEKKKTMPPQSSGLREDFNDTDGYGIRIRNGWTWKMRNGRHHHQEFRAGDPQGLEKWFNFRLSSLRSVIERCFGILKKRFPILREMPWGLRLKTQKYLVIACCAVHNFIV